MSVIKHVTITAAFCKKESQRFWDTKGKTWWSCGKTFSTLACKAILEDAFGGQEHIETFCYEAQSDERLISRGCQQLTR
ncbi:hypothetical protein [Desulfoplanes formicivorans]|uniref:hypothetical protein n=1 Tax=Desulfoplanes formicivorans TaxID=1592317 RepID=UPI000852A61B|nr:hypothetical protein [Desulfoplanes formicivorans]